MSELFPVRNLRLAIGQIACLAPFGTVSCFGRVEAVPAGVMPCDAARPIRYRRAVPADPGPRRRRPPSCARPVRRSAHRPRATGRISGIPCAGGTTGTRPWSRGPATCRDGRGVSCGSARPMTRRRCSSRARDQPTSLRSFRMTPHSEPTTRPPDQGDPNETRHIFRPITRNLRFMSVGDSGYTFGRIGKNVVLMMRSSLCGSKRVAG